MTERIPIVILAGGSGARIGGNKPHRLLAGASLLDQAIAKAASYSSPVAVSVGGGEISSVGNIPQLLDDEHMQGPIAGLAAALKFASSIDASQVMMMPCDTPFLPDDMCQRLTDSIGTYGVAVAQYGGRLHPACSLWRADAASFLPGYLARGRRSLTGFAETARLVAVDWPEEPVDPFLNINTPEELMRAEQIFARRQKKN